MLWALVGAGACLAVLGAASIGLLVAPVVAASAWVLLVTTPADRSLAGAVSGASLPLLYVAWLNRAGPGEVCRVEVRFTECSERWSPWPWLVAGLVLLAAGVTAFRLLGRGVRRVAA